MNLLALDTSSSACSVAILKNNEIVALHKIAPMQQAKLILPMIDEILTANELSLSKLDAIAYGCGPGSFTGIRIASSVTQGLAFAAKKPIIRISSMAAIAQAAWLEKQWTSMMVALDARMGQLYFASYTVNQHGIVELAGEEQVCAPDQIAIPARQKWAGVGDGWSVYKEAIIQRVGFEPAGIDPIQLPNATAILQLARRKFESGDLVSISNAVPAYLR